MADEELRQGSEVEGLTETVMQQYLYPGQWFDDMGAILGNTGPGMVWDFGTSSLDRDTINDMINLFQDSGVDAYPEG